MQNKCEKIGQHLIYLDEIYYIAYAGGKRELTAKDQLQYNKISTLPFALQRKELSKISFDKNPNVIPIKGSVLMSLIKELNFIPFFDEYFKQSHLIKLTDVIIYESIKQRNYNIALRT
jgi:hypothetical protein